MENKDKILDVIEKSKEVFVAAYTKEGNAQVIRSINYETLVLIFSSLVEQDQGMFDVFGAVVASSINDVGKEQAERFMSAVTSRRLAKRKIIPMA